MRRAQFAQAESVAAARGSAPRHSAPHAARALCNRRCWPWWRPACLLCAMAWIAAWICARRWRASCRTSWAIQKRGRRRATASIPAAHDPKHPAEPGLSLDDSTAEKPRRIGCRAGLRSGYRRRAGCRPQDRHRAARRPPSWRNPRNSKANRSKAAEPEGVSANPRRPAVRRWQAKVPGAGQTGPGRRPAGFRQLRRKLQPARQIQRCHVQLDESHAAAVGRQGRAAAGRRAE